jgi:N-acetylmuramoyl-L-alanine amidase
MEGMRQIKYIVLHCTATPGTVSVKSIQTYWREVLKWKNPGYHWLVKTSGQPVSLLPIEEIANGVAGYNKEAIHISYIGGIDSQGDAQDTRTNAQKLTMLDLVRKYKNRFPHAQVLGHRDFPKVTKRCPSFEVAEWCECVGIESKPI